MLYYCPGHPEGRTIADSMSFLKVIPAALLVLGGCSRAKIRETEVRCLGRPPYGALYFDSRAVTEFCPDCSQPVGRADKECGNLRDGVKCGTLLHHPDRIPCGFCRASRQCDPCSAFRTAGKCRYCAGGGRLDPYTTCFNCNGSGVCAACRGPAACDACGGSGELALPWSPRSGTELQPKATLEATLRRVRSEPYIVWRGNTFALPEATRPWVIYRAERGLTAEMGRMSGGGSYRANEMGSYVAVSGETAVPFEVVQLETRSPLPGTVGLGSSLQGSLETSPRLKNVRVHWEGASTALEGIEFTLASPPKGRYEIWPVVKVGELPPQRASQPMVFDVIELRIVPPVTGPLVAGTPIEFRVEATPPLERPAAYEWTVASPDGSWSLTTAGPSANLRLARAGRHRIDVRNGSVNSSPLEVVTYAVSLIGEDGNPAREIGLALFENAFDARGIITSDWVEHAPEALRIRLEDPAAGPAPSATVATFRADGTPLNPSVSYPLPGGASRKIVFVADPTDDGFGVEGIVDDAPNDPTILATVGGRVEIHYRGIMVLSVPIGPAWIKEIPVRIFVLREGRGALLPPSEMERALDRRLEQANRIWMPFWLRFTRAALEIVDSPRNLLLIADRAAGVDERGRPARSGIIVNGASYLLRPSPAEERSAMTPAVTAQILARTLGEPWRLDVVGRQFATDSEALVVRLARVDSAPVTIEALDRGRDISQLLTPLVADVSNGCQIAPRAPTLSIDEIGILLGLKKDMPAGIDLFVVEEIWAGLELPTFKAYPEGIFSPYLAHSALVSWALLDGTGKFPYGLARIFGEIFLPPGFRPADPHSLFAEPLSEDPAVETNKRVGSKSGAKISERARRRAVERKIYDLWGKDHR